MTDYVPNTVQATTAAPLSGFCTAATWYLVDSDALSNLVVTELINEIKGAYVPTDVNKTLARARKFRYTERFSREKFN